MRAKATLAAQKFDIGDVRASVKLRTKFSMRRSRGLAPPEAMVLLTLISLSEVGAENRVNPLLGYTRAARLLKLHREVPLAPSSTIRSCGWRRMTAADSILTW